MEPSGDADTVEPTGQPVRDPALLRVSDAEREHVVGVLQKAVGRGMLTLDEFTARSDVALAAKTRGELNQVLLDLPGLTNRETGQLARPADAAVSASDRPLVLRSTMGGQKRSGPWVVPRQLVIHSRMGSTELDFTDARIDHAQVDIQIDVTAGSVELWVPTGASVRGDDVQVIAGSFEDRRRVPDDGTGRPLFVLTGRVVAGSVEVRRPKYAQFGPLTVRRPWRLSWRDDESGQ